MGLHYLFGESGRAHVFVAYCYDQKAEEVVVDEIDIYSGKLLRQCRVMMELAPPRVQAQIEKLNQWLSKPK